MHINRTAPLLLGCALALAATTMSPADFLYDESNQGDLSNDPTAPTALELGLGDNVLNGSTGLPFDPEGDFFSITIGDGLKLESIIVLFYLSPGDPDNDSFIGFDAGAALDPADLEPPFDGLLGWTELSAGDIGTDILPDMGFESLQPGVFSFAMIEGGPKMTYTLNFVTIPAPSAWLVMAAVAIGRSRRRRRG